MVHKVTVTATDGENVSTDTGENLVVIGNHVPVVGEEAWSDGKVLYGHDRIHQLVDIPASLPDGVPVLGTNMAGYLDKFAAYHPYGIYGSAIVNTSRICTQADPGSLDSEITDDSSTYAIYGGSYLWTAGNIVEHDNAFHYMDADGHPFDPNGNVRHHTWKTYYKWHDMSMEWHEKTSSGSSDEKKFDYFDSVQTIFESPFGGEYRKSDDASIVSNSGTQTVSLKTYADTAGVDLKNALPKILEVVGKQNYEPAMMTPSFVLEGKKFWLTAVSAHVKNGKVFQDGSWWMLLEASASAKCVAWCDFCENKITHKEERREYNDGNGSAWDGRIVESRHNITCEAKHVSKYGLADIGLTEYLLVTSGGGVTRLRTTYTTPDKRSGYLMAEETVTYETHHFRDLSPFGIVRKEYSETGTYNVIRVQTTPVVVYLDPVKPDGSDVVNVSVGDGFSIISDMDGTVHEVYCNGSLVTADVPFSASDNVSACVLYSDDTKTSYLVGVHGNGLYLVENGTTEHLEDGLRNYRLRYMSPVSFTE